MSNNNTVDVSKMTDVNALRAMIAKLEQEKAELAAKAAKNNALSIKVARDKGGISIYGLQKFPVTLHYGQWERFFAEGLPEKLKTFMANPEVIKLATIGKDDPDAEAKKIARLAHQGNLVSQQSEESKKKYGTAS